LDLDICSDQLVCAAQRSASTAASAGIHST
jgi:hypothetical protein